VSSLISLRSEKCEARFLVKAIEKPRPEAERILHETVDDSLRLSHVTHLFTGRHRHWRRAFRLMGERLRAAIATTLPRYIMKVFRPGPAGRLAASARIRFRRLPGRSGQQQCTQLIPPRPRT